MGNTHGKEARGGSRFGPGAGADAGGSSGGAGYQGDLPDRSRRVSRAELAALGLPITGNSTSRRQDAPFEHRETRQEREARRLERERVARVKERDRSMREEHVDGGYLVTTGIYTASEDFSKPVVRQLQIERRLAPFWRGLDDFNHSWAEHQIIAAARGLEIPPADKVPENLVPRPRPADSASPSTPNSNNLTVPIGPRTMSASSDMSGSNPSTLPSPTSPAPRTSSPLKPHKALAAALNLTRNGSNTDITPREINLPQDPFVNGQPLEVFLYKEGTECPLCLMYYPPYMNRTRCCDQLICSECFVQIKRPDPHYPEHHDEEGGAGTPASNEEPTGELIMEPAKCPYCTQTEFGVTYEPPPFRRGLTYAFNTPALGSMGTAMSSSSSLHSNLSPMPPTSPTQVNRKRAQSLAANAPGVITTDRIRPEWTTKLAAARAQQHRRAAAADALHHAAFMMSNNESRSIFSRSSRFSRRTTRDNRGTETPGGSTNPQSQYDGNTESHEGGESGSRHTAGRSTLGRERFDAAHLESMMMAEAIRLSLADEEERRLKAEKEARKEAKKREKDERKAAKKNKGDVYGSYAGSGASASSLSLSLGRRRGNSALDNLRTDAPSIGQNNGPISAASGSGSAQLSSEDDKGKAVDRNEASSSRPDSTHPPALTASSTQSRVSSHLRQMSNASSISSDVDTVSGSYTGKDTRETLQNRRSSGLSLGGHTDEEDTTTTPSEPMFNFRSLAEMVGVPIDGEPGDDDQGPESKTADANEARGEHVEHAANTIRPRDRHESEKTNSLLPPIRTSSNSSGTAGRDGSLSPPQLIVTPETPGTDESKQFGQFNTSEQQRPLAQ